MLKPYERPRIKEKWVMPRPILYLLDRDSLLLMLEISDWDWDYIAECYGVGDLPRAAIESYEWLEDVIKMHPGLWTAEICRIKHAIPSSNWGIAYCGLCTEYANPRKRARSEALGDELPEFPGRGGLKLHPPCSTRALTWLRQTTDRWAAQGMVVKAQTKIPDIRQARGWDIGTRIYWNWNGETDEKINVSELHKEQESRPAPGSDLIQLSLVQPGEAVRL